MSHSQQLSRQRKSNHIFILTSVILLPLIFHTCGCIDSASAGETDKVKELSEERKAKLFLYPFIRVTNTLCGPVDNRGSCFTSKNCTAHGGTPIQGISCANGFGVCCELTLTCNAEARRLTTSERAITLAGTGATGGCMFTIAKVDPDICQLQVSLTEFNLRDPDTGGNCQQSALTITDSLTVTNSFKLCGMQTGRRLFLTFDRVPGSTINLNFKLAGADSHKVKIAQIKCNDKIVPDHCLEYYDDTTDGRVTNFGHPTYMINNPIYSICVESAGESTQIAWKECAEAGTAVTGTTFRLSPYFTNINGMIRAPITGHDNCLMTTFVDIIGEQRHCGARLNVLDNAPDITSVVKPFSLAVRVIQDIHSNLQTNYMFPYAIQAAPPPLCAEFSNMIQGFTTCSPITVTVGGVVVNLYCMCGRIEPIPVPDPPASPPRSGFCLTYTVT